MLLGSKPGAFGHGSSKRSNISSFFEGVKREEVISLMNRRSMSALVELEHPIESGLGSGLHTSNAAKSGVNLSGEILHGCAYLFSPQLSFCCRLRRTSKPDSARLMGSTLRWAGWGGGGGGGRGPQLAQRRLGESAVSRENL